MAIRQPHERVPDLIVLIWLGWAIARINSLAGPGEKVADKGNLVTMQ